MPANDNLPLTLTRQQAAALCGLKPSGFSEWVRRGVVPKPIPGTHRWSRIALERALSGDTAGPASNDNLSPFEQWKMSRESQT
ncbi:hypothetical protein HW532_12875 [Kaustia mangrovi]|uniref:Helix-turn-helix domain-containing protein n=1 Tax=Kaustia mangrovi TaxID=2593653 RepID=A0A7S8C506_9HYPH|nr:hypothetical protein [Kaustia mangrovi]QPC43511.1 hypothetical protein HW532_12875 [Kaustia mangrovi]